MKKLSLACLALWLSAPVIPAADKPVPAPHPALLSLPENTATNLGPFKWDRPEGEPYTGAVTDYSGMTYDMHNHRILMFGGGHSATWTDAIYVFSFKTLQWSSLYKPTPYKFYTKDNMDKSWWKSGPEGSYPRPVGRHTYDLLVVPDDREELHMLRTGTGPSAASHGFGYIGGYGGVYSFTSNSWKRVANGFGGYGAVAEYDPVSKKIIGQAKQDVHAVDPVTGKSETILRNIQDQFKVTGYSGSMIYFPPDKKMYVIPADKKIWALVLDSSNLKNSKIEKFEASGSCPASESSFVYDSKNKIIGGGVLDNKFYVFDPATKTWTSKEIQGGNPGTMTFHCIGYSPIDNVYIFIAGNRVWAYRWK